MDRGPLRSAPSPVLLAGIGFSFLPLCLGWRGAVGGRRGGLSSRSSPGIWRAGDGGSTHGLHYGTSILPERAAKGEALGTHGWLQQSGRGLGGGEKGEQRARMQRNAGGGVILSQQTSPPGAFLSRAAPEAIGTCHPSAEAQCSSLISKARAPWGGGEDSCLERKGERRGRRAPEQGPFQRQSESHATGLHPQTHATKPDTTQSARMARRAHVPATRMLPHSPWPMPADPVITAPPTSPAPSAGMSHGGHRNSQVKQRWRV